MRETDYGGNWALFWWAGPCSVNLESKFCWWAETCSLPVITSLEIAPCVLLGRMNWSCPVFSSSSPPPLCSQTSLSFTVSQSLLKLMSIESVMPYNHLVLCRPLLHFLPQSFLASGSFLMCQLFASGDQSIGASASVVQAYLLHIMWALHEQGIKPMFPALVGGFLSTAPTGKSTNGLFLLF